ncbi:ABC transporter ATP-binding protein/permease [Candidatus Bandiella numerosa]|uniref:ABC transporter ATP-binding protein n=1 Tax=Candidatus Bandiella numerosa TaxID=2570586 RepID=UPI00249F3FD4|nr:ABC transporter ATP-binding protein [Candidatus Bandiella numerosa]WHA04474.1 ABC transporter ATP-binding protein/permease [Candidatus Bandiella numerosa]
MFNIKKTNYIIEILKPFFLQLFIILLLILIWTCSETFLLYILKWTIDDLHQTTFTNEKYWLYIGLFILIIFFIEMPMRIANFLHAKLSPKISHILRDKLTAKLLKKDLMFFNHNKIGDLSSKIAQLPNAIENTIKTSLYGVIAGSFSFLVMIALIALDLWTIGIYFVIWYVLMITIGIYFIKNTIKLSQSYAHDINLANAELTELLQNILNIKVAAKESYESFRIKKFYNNIAHNQTLLEILLFKADTLRSIISAFLLIGLFSFSLLQVLKGLATVGDLTFITSAAFIARRDIWRVSLQLTEIYKDFGFIKKIQAIASSSSQQSSKKTLTNIKSMKLDHAYFSFNKNQCILKDINLEIKEGQKIALVGTSGAGKTTLAKILQGVYRLQQGNFLINGTDNYYDFSSNNIISHLTYIPQEPILFNRSIRDNITYLDNQADDEKVKKIAKITLCEDFINQLPLKYETILSNLGNNLSAGQKQRLALARALCSKTKWLVLDEPSSALDSITEISLIKNLLSHCQDYTLIFITHNTKIMELMDEIVFLQHGSIVAKNNYTNLNKKFTTYNNLINQISYDK